MIRTIEAVVDEQGHVRLLEDVRLPLSRRALVTILEEPPRPELEPTLLSEPASAQDGNGPEEDEAWSQLAGDPVRLDELRREIAIGIDQADRGETAPFEPLATLARVRSRRTPSEDPA